MIEKGVELNKYHKTEKEKRAFIIDTLVILAKESLGLEREEAIERIKKYLGIEIMRGYKNDAGP